MLEWLQNNLGKIIALVFVVVSIARSISEARAKAAPPPDAGEEERRAQEVREKVRRTIAERRRSAGGDPTAPVPPPPLTQPAEPPVADPLGDLGRRIQTELERRLAPEPAPVVAAPPAPVISRSELDRQQQLADELRQINEERQRAARRAAGQAAADEAAAASPEGRRASARAEVLSDLRDRGSLRRAFVLREVLGPPVGLR